MSLTRRQLPVRLTPLVGRESELDDIVQALHRNRLITLTGPGGTGKTRLALAAARTADASFPAGVCWVALAQIDDPAIAGQAVATQLGVPDTPGQDPIEAIAKHVADHRLVVLDNCEHLADAAASLAEYLLAACPALVVLATSREALGVEGELSWQVPPLSLPAGNSAPTASALAAFDAVKLFEQRARLVRPSFRITDENAAAVLAICQRLDGLPLAIELAAARMRILSSAQLAERMDDIFAVLVGGARSAPPRHQALRATLDWSYDLLEQVEAAAGLLELELDRLDAELPNLRRAFEFAQESGDPVAPLRIAGPLDRYAYLRGRYHEVRQWMDAAVTSCPDAPAALRAKALLGGGRLALLQCDYAPAVRRLEPALRLYRELGDPRGVASSLQVLGSVAREQGRYARAVELHAESLAIAEAAGDRWAVASAHGYLAFASWLQRDFGRAAEEAGTALAQFRELGDIEGAAWSLISLGTVARYQGNVERASVLLTESLALSEGIGFREGIAWSVEQLGLLAAVDGDPAAISLLRRSLELHSELRDRWRVSSVLEDLAAIALAQGNARQAARLLGAAEAVRETIGTVIAPCERLQHNQTTKAVRTELGDEAFDAALRQGQLASMDELTADLPSADPPGPSPAAPSSACPDQADPDHAPPDQAAPEQAELDKAAPEAPRPARPRAASRPRAGPPAAGNGAAATGMLRIRALGAAAVQVGDTALTAADWSYAKPRELMFLLASSPPMTKDQIAAALWPDLSRQQLGNALHTALRELRRALGDAGWVQYSDGHYRFDRSRPHECDVTAFEDALVAARRARPAQAALPELQRAIAAYGGDFLDGMATGEWALVRRDELRRAFESTLLATGRLQAAAGRHQAAAAAFRKAVAHEPLNESAHRELMNCWVRLGETARAVRHYEELVGVLRDQVGVAPAAETEALYRRLLAAR